MHRRTPLAALAAAAALTIASGCAVMHGQEAVGAYVDDASITTSIQARIVEDKSVDAAAIQVETMHGNVVLSGFAKDRLEKQTAGSLAIKVKGVKSVQNNVVVRP